MHELIGCFHHNDINGMSLGYKYTLAFRLGSSIYVKLGDIMIPDDVQVPEAKVWVYL